MLKRDPQERKQDRECAKFMLTNERGRKTRFLKDVEGLEITDALALNLFHSDLSLLDDKLYCLYAQSKIEFGFDLSTAYNQMIDYFMAINRGQECSPPTTRMAFDSELRRWFVFRDYTLYQKLVARMGEYAEIAARRGTLLIYLYDLEGTPSDRFYLYLQKLGEVSTSVWNNFCFAHILAYGASDVIPGMVESLTKLTPFEEGGGNRLYTVLSQMEGDIHENLRIEILLKLPDRLNEFREAGTGIADLRDRVANVICKENRSNSIPARKMVSINTPVGSGDTAMTIEDTLSAVEDGYDRIEQQAELAETLASQDPERKKEVTHNLDKAGYKDQKIADLMGESLSGVKMRLHRTRKRA